MSDTQYDSLRAGIIRSALTGPADVDAHRAEVARLERLYPAGAAEMTRRGNAAVECTQTLMDMQAAAQRERQRDRMVRKTFVR